MKIIFSAIKNSGIFEDDFMHLPEEKGTIEFKRMQTAGGIAVIYAPNGTGKTSFANLLSTEVSNENIFFDAVDERGNRIAPESGVFHVIQDQINRNVIRGETTDYLIGAQIRREYDLRNQINILFTQTPHIVFSYAPWKFNIWQLFSCQCSVNYAACSFDFKSAGIAFINASTSSSIFSSEISI